jgi:hypothetical protein
MRLCCVDHYRCDEPAASTYVWCEDDWAEDQFREAVGRAEKAYNTALKEYSEATTKDPYPRGVYTDPDFKEYPDLKVSEVIAIHEEKKLERDKWKAKESNATRSFSKFLEDEGLVDFYSVEAEYEVDIWWGHRHGDAIEYGDNSPWDKDLREKAKKVKTKRRVVRRA